jgi:allophanate hydrolase subunit 2
VVTGAIQVPGDGHPILLGPDRPVTGGYAKIATVIAADLGLIAQARPGDSLRFVEVTLDDARAARRERESALVQSIEDIA